MTISSEKLDTYQNCTLKKKPSKSRRLGLAVLCQRARSYALLQTCRKADDRARKGRPDYRYVIPFRYPSPVSSRFFLHSSCSNTRSQFGVCVGMLGACSIAGKTGAPNSSAYCASKFAVRGLTQSAGECSRPRKLGNMFH